MGDMVIGPATIRYSHCAERVRRHFQIDVYKTYERTTLLGTIEEVKEPPPRIRNMKKKVLWAGGRGGGGGDSEKNEAPTHTIKKSLHPAAEGGGVETPIPTKIDDFEDSTIQDLHDNSKIMIYSEQKFDFEIKLLENWIET